MRNLVKELGCNTYMQKKKKPMVKTLEIMIAVYLQSRNKVIFSHLLPVLLSPLYKMINERTVFFTSFIHGTKRARSTYPSIMFLVPYLLL